MNKKLTVLSLLTVLFFTVSGMIQGKEVLDPLPTGAIPPSIILYLVLDNTPPTPGDSGTITATSITLTSLAINWMAATDDESNSSDLEYLVYYSTSNNISTVTNCEANGTAVGSYATNIVTKPVTGLAAGTMYYFNVVVKDEAWNKSTYGSLTDATLQDSDDDGVADRDDLCADTPAETLVNADGCPDADGDGVTDEDDVCPDFDDAIDEDNDGLPDDCDDCPLEAGPIDNNGCQTAGCYNLGGSYVDNTYIGPINQVGNLTMHVSVDGSCTGVYPGEGMWVQTNLLTDTEVLDFCNTIGAGFTWVIKLVDAGINVDLTNPAVIPDETWVCGFDNIP